VGLRGAVPIVFATYPLLAGIEKANVIFNLVFFIAVTSVMIQGTTLSAVAKWLTVALPEGLKRKTPLDIFLSDQEKNMMREFRIPEESYAVGKKILDINFPASSVISMIIRNDKYITPKGSTDIQANDRLIILCDNEKGFDLVERALGL
jgi:cell volume regulation protein A